MLGLLGVVRPWLPRLPLGRSRQAGLDIVGHILFQHRLTRSEDRRVAAVERMTIQRMEHVGIVVDDLAAATAFFVELGRRAGGADRLRAPAGDARRISWVSR
jgi:hypothetical protein